MSRRHGTFSHPRAFYVLFSIEMWERFGYYGMQALMVLFLVHRLGMDDAAADATFSAFAALVYAFICVGGWLGDHVLGNRRTMFLGALVLAAGYGLLGLDSQGLLFPSLGVIVAGNALFKANPSALVSKLYDAGDPRVDGAFTLYYMAVNVGSFLSMLLAPVVEKYYGWDAAFDVCFAGMGVAIVNALMFRRVLAGVGSEADERPFCPWRCLLALGLAAAIATASGFLLTHLTLAYGMLATAGLVVAVLMVREFVRASRAERANLAVCLVLMAEAVAFFVLYQQMPTSLNLFALRNVHPAVLGVPLEPASFQALNPMWIMLLSPVLAWVYGGLGRTGRDFSLPVKFACGMLVCSLGFLVLSWACGSAGADAMVSGNWLLASYGLQSLGELLISGLGLAMVARLAPERSMGFMMGAWFMSQSLAMVLGGLVAAGASLARGGAAPAASTLPLYEGLFTRIGLVSLGLALLMGLAARPLSRRISAA